MKPPKASKAAPAGGESGDSVDSGDKGVEKAGTESGTETAAEANAALTISGEGTLSGSGGGKAGEAPAEEEPAAGEDHISAFERRCDRLSRIAEEADFESGTIVGDLRDIYLDLAKAQPKGWGHMSEDERKDFARTCEKIAKIVLRKVVQIIAEEDEISVHAKLAGYKVNGDSFVLTAKATGDKDTAVQLFLLDGHEVVIISADSSRFHGQKRDPNIPPDRPELPFADPAPAEIRSDPPEHPDDDSDLAAGPEKATALDALGEFERVNLKTGMIESDTTNGNAETAEHWADVREATPEELAAERNRIADFEVEEEQTAGEDDEAEDEREALDAGVSD